MTAANSGKTLPSVGAWGEASKIIITELQNVLQGKKTPKQGADDMAAQINPLL
jgi:ABC-type glycerol-3-phosphate transport system substrate-binding protein